LPFIKENYLSTKKTKFFSSFAQLLTDLGLGSHKLPANSLLCNASKSTRYSPMYTHSQPMNVHNQIASPGVDDDRAPADSIDHHHHIHYEDGTPTVVDDVSPESVYVNAGVAASELGIQPSDCSSQLTLTFRGQVYVFDSVTPDKVRFLFLICENKLFTFFII